MFVSGKGVISRTTELSRYHRETLCLPRGGLCKVTLRLSTCCEGPLALKVTRGARHDHRRSTSTLCTYTYSVYNLIFCVQYHVASFHMLSSRSLYCHALHCHMSSCHVFSCHILSCDSLSYLVVLGLAMLYCHILSCHISSCRISSCHILSCQVLCCRILRTEPASCRIGHESCCKGAGFYYAICSLVVNCPIWL